MRLGYLIVPKKMARTLQKIHQNFFICANAFVQWAALTALTDKRVKRELEMMRIVYNIRRKVMVALLREIGFGILHPPGGAFYVKTEIDGLGNHRQAEVVLMFSKKADSSLFVEASSRPVEPLL
jgi:aspartate aminotransferase